MNIPAHYAEVRPWWHRRRQFSLAELIADGIVHGIGLLFAISLGTVLIVFAAIGTARPELPAIIIYLVTLLTVLGVSLAQLGEQRKTPHRPRVMQKTAIKMGLIQP